LLWVLLLVRQLLGLGRRRQLLLAQQQQQQQGWRQG
jgi:hypothetical protein